MPCAGVFAGESIPIRCNNRTPECQLLLAGVLFM